MDERIELYFNEKLPPGEREEFEKELLRSSQLADEVAFYLNTRAVLREQILAERHAEWQKPAASRRIGKPFSQVFDVRSWYYTAAAAVLLVIMRVSWFLVNPLAPNVRQLAESYVETSFDDLGTTMGTATDSLQQAFNHYYQGRYAEAQVIGQKLLQRNSTNEDALKLLGAISLRQKDYDQAIAYFHRQAGIPGLRANPGTFYEALAYVQRGQPSDLEKARELLQKVVSEEMEGQEEAREMLRALDEKQRNWRDLIPGWGEREASE